MYTHVVSPNDNSCRDGSGISGHRQGGGTSAFTASSNHRGGVNVLMGDGTVKFAKDTIDGNIWSAVGTRNGNEPIGG